jgi:hypothetical protein
VRLRFLRRPGRAGVVVLVVSGAVLGAGCAPGGYDAGELQAGLERAGLTPVQARCVTAGMERTFDLQQLASYTEPTERERRTLRRLVAGCTAPPTVAP